MLSRELLQPELVKESPRYAGYSGMSERLDEIRRDMVFSFHDLGDLPVTEKNVREEAMIDCMLELEGKA